MKQIVLPKRLSPEFINNIFFPDYVRCNNVCDINSGRCYDWAYYVYCLYPTAQLWTTDYHAWVRYSGRFWDSESPRGVKDVDSLGCNSRWGWESIPPKPIDVVPFKRLWSRFGRGRKYHWDLMLEEIRAAGLTPLRK